MSEDSTPRIDRRRLLEVAALGAAGLVPGGVGTATGGAGSRTGGSPGRSTVAVRGAAGQLSPRVLEEPPAAGAWVRLDRTALAANLETVREAAGGRPVMGVVKANAYGHGLVPAASGLAEAGVDSLMVVTVDEAAALRDAGMDIPVMNFGPFDVEAASLLVSRGIDQAVYSVEAVRGMAAAARERRDAAGRPASVHVMIDTGLGRVGVPWRRALEVLEAVAAEPALRLAGTMTTFTEDPEFDREQLRRFLEVLDDAGSRGIEAGIRHAASSAAVLEFPDAHLDAVRPGITLYGHYPNDATRRARPIELRPVLSLEARVALVKALEPGDSIGYHRPYTASVRETVATLPVGYSEGYPPAAVEAGGWVWIRGRACPLVGGVTSNHMEVRVPDDVTVEPGDVATLFGGSQAPPAAAGEPAGSAGGQAGEPEEPRAVTGPPRAHLVAGWGGVSVYNLHMRLSPLLPRLVA